ncbi:MULTISPECIES: hypothetical protein [Edwardsiella]|uniref:Uncharacterized protein n=2 Tax=Edwardsiella anguillarum TaxID=1821960 RepID=A0A076LRC1_9GAMM|nr:MULTISPECIES: hypothetical protein [Edwardsiella]AIJ09093.1 Hypothetical protein ETEE_2659 [Edwardsiella anguillarum ET080813]UBU94871.1 hypothetical protein AAZ33_18670 [Edwardsiella sp. LADL05-105]UOU80290.1 hypothetical protein MUN71_06750 [Edwardsiella anguillarum]WHP81048.1 hypothetical protein MQ090_03960 [Edwardsiella anguillarum]WHP84689.1 hypothetical protein MQ095_04340 [Edwardsiella anguillarum]
MANSTYQQFVKWSVSGTATPIQSLHRQESLRREHPGLLPQDAEAFYKLLLEPAGANV